MRELSGLFNNLRIENNKKIKELEIKNKDIKNLKGTIEKFEKEDFNRKFTAREKRLDELINELGISRQKYRDLLKFYQQLIRFSENYNLDLLIRLLGYSWILRVIIYILLVIINRKNV